VMVTLHTLESAEESKNQWLGQPAKMWQHIRCSIVLHKPNSGFKSLHKLAN